jgi:DNA-binding protein H-NS
MVEAIKPLTTKERHEMITFTNNAKKLRASIYEADFNALVEFKEKFDEIFAERKEEEETRLQETEKKKEVLSQIRELLAAQGISEINADDLEENDPLLALLEVKGTLRKPQQSLNMSLPMKKVLNSSGLVVVVCRLH